MSSLLRFDCVSFAYGANPVLVELSFELPGNGLMALVGPNGAGKSTLLRLAAGLLAALEGSIHIDGRPVDDWPRRELARTVALVPQELEVPFPFTVEQVVAQGRVPYQGWLGRVSRRDQEAIERAIHLTSIAHLRNRTMNEISGGERQRVKVAIALAQEPRLMLLDEPLQYLDIGRQSELLDLLLNLHGGGLGIVAAMHDLAAVRAHFPLTLLLMGPRTARDCEYVFGPTEQVLTNELVTTAFDLSRLYHVELEPLLHRAGTNYQQRPRHNRTWR